MTVTIEKILQKRNKSMYWLAKETGITYQNIIKLCQNKTTSINFERLEKICKALKCTPNDILNID